MLLVTCHASTFSFFITLFIKRVEIFSLFQNHFICQCGKANSVVYCRMFIIELSAVFIVDY